MRILFVSSSPIRKEISIGNTFLNLFSDMENVEFASIYTRAGQPDPAVSQCFCITEKMLIKNLFGKGQSGKKMDFATCADAKQGMASDSKSVSFAKRHRWTMLFWLQDFVWRVGRWKTKALQEFIEEYQPDVVFTVLSSTAFLNRLILHVKQVAKVPLIVYAWDDNYSMKRVMFSPLRWIHHILGRRSMRRMVKHAEQLYVISGVQKEDYEKAFKRECKVLTKGADFSGEPPVQSAHNEPLQLLYTGNIGLRRWESLASIARVLEKINKEGVKAQLRIYSGNALTEKMQKALNRGESSFFMGSVPGTAVAGLQAEADILVHVEPMNIKSRLLVRQSFSTKLVDYFHQGKAIVAYGPKNVASIAHLIKHEAAVFADTEEKLEAQLTELFASPERLEEYARRAWACGKEKHRRDVIQKMLMTDLQNAVQQYKMKNNK